MLCKNWRNFGRMSDCEELVGRSITGVLEMAGTSQTVKKAVSSKAVEFLYGSKGDMSRRKSLGRTARNKRKSR